MTTLLVVAFAVAWVWWVPRAVEGRLRDAAQRRGMQASLVGIEGGLTPLVLVGLELRRGDTMLVSARRVDTGADLFSLISSGTDAVQHVELDGVELDVDLSGDLRAMVRELRGSSSAGASGTVVSRRTARVRNATVRVRDRRGTLVLIERGEAQFDGETLTASAPSTAIAPRESDGVEFGAVTLRARREDGAWELRRAAIESASVHYIERPTDERSPVWSRLAGALRQLSTVAGVADTEEPPRPGTSQQDRAETRSDPVGSGTGTMASLAGAVARVAPLLNEGAELHLAEVTVEMRSEGTSVPVLRGLEADLRVVGEDRYRLEGSGRPGRGGRLGWNVMVEPNALRADGRVDFQRLPFALVLPLVPELPWYQPEETRLTGELTVRGAGPDDVHLEGRVRVEDLALSSARIAPTPVRRIGFEVEGVADLAPLDRRLSVSRVEVRSGDAVVRGSGTLEWPEDHYLVDVRATLPPTQCNAAVGAIPSDLLGELTTMTLRGQIGGRVRTRIDSRELESTELEISVADGCRFETVPPLADVERFQAPFSHRVLEPDGSTFEMQSGPESANWVPLTNISPFFVQAVLGHEDGGFFRHSGFATHAIRLALIRNLTAGRFVYGASTITMQLVKNVFLHREKTLARKVQEVLLTWWVENAMSKAEILELYLNVIEYGPSVYGIRHAADHYFGRPASELGPAEAAYLATILPNPPVFHEHWEEDALPSRHRRRVARFLRTMHSRGRFDARALEYGLARLEEFDFHQPGEPLPRLHENPGAVRPLPIDPTLFQGAWDEAFGEPGADGMSDDADGAVLDPWADDGNDGV